MIKLEWKVLTFKFYSLIWRLAFVLTFCLEKKVLKKVLIMIEGFNMPDFNANWSCVLVKCQKYWPMTNGFSESTTLYKSWW